MALAADGEASPARLVAAVPDDRLVGGVAAGIPAWTGIDVTIVRIGFVFASLVSGVGAVGYVVGWLMLPGC